MKARFMNVLSILHYLSNKRKERWTMISQFSSYSGKPAGASHIEKDTKIWDERYETDTCAMTHQIYAKRRELGSANLSTWGKHSSSMQHFDLGGDSRPFVNLMRYSGPIGSAKLCARRIDSMIKGTIFQNGSS